MTEKRFTNVIGIDIIQTDLLPQLIQNKETGEMEMTENKRFMYYEHKGADYILDNPNTELDFIEMLGDCLEAEEIVDLLNKLNNENEELKEFKKRYDELLVDYNNLATNMENVIISKYNDLTKELNHWAEKEDLQSYRATQMERGVVIEIAKKLGIDLE